MKVSPETIARASSRHPWRVIGIWLLVIAGAAAAIVPLLGGVLNNDIEFTNRPEAVRARAIVDDRFALDAAGASTEYVIVSSAAGTVDDPAFRDYVERLRGALAADAELVAEPPVTYYDLAEQAPEQAAGLVSEDRTATLVPVALQEDDTEEVEALRALLGGVEQEGFTTQLVGQATLFADFSTIAEEDARKGESIGVMAALIVLVVVFGAIVAALVPIGIGVAAIAISLGAVALIGQLVEFNLFVTNMISMIGLAVGIDYSLFIVSRFREERKKGFDRLEAIGAAGATANRAVFFSGMTVVLALVGMFILPTTIFRSLAAGAIIVTLVSIAASMTLLPAILAKLGDRINWPRLARRARLDVPHDVPDGMWDRITRGVMRRPVVFLLLSLFVLGGLGTFYFQLERGNSTTTEQLPDEMGSKSALLTLERQFAGGLTQPVQIVLTGGAAGARAEIEELRAELDSMPVFAPATTVQPSQDGSAVLVSAYFRGDAADQAAFDAIGELRDEVVPRVFGAASGEQVLVGGETAFFADFLALVDDYQPIVFAFVLGLSFVLLTIVFRSIVVPIKAILMNLLSVGAAYGAITLVFQKGVGIGFFNAIGFNFVRSEAIEAWLPLFLFSVLFGLSMDYHVFLLTRIREEYDKTGDNTEAVAYGLRTTAGIITGAAVIMVVVFTGFASGRLGPLQQMGFGLAVAVFMDATIVRTVLVPAAMRLLGDANWYLPGWLQWLPDIHVEGREPSHPVAVDRAEELVEAVDPSS
jgi:RND superfamily putative drug exporter